MQKRPTFLLCVAGCLTLVSCGRSDESIPAASDTSPSTATQSSSTITAAGDPCTFFSEQELEQALGYELQAGEPRPGEPSCRFTSFGGGSVTITVPAQAVTPEDFNEFRDMIGPDAEAVSGVGDAAYFWGSRIYVRRGGRQLTISVADRELTPPIRSALTSLGQTGASRLR